MKPTLTERLKKVSPFLSVAVSVCVRVNLVDAHAGALDSSATAGINGGTRTQTDNKLTRTEKPKSIFSWCQFNRLVPAVLPRLSGRRTNSVPLRGRGLPDRWSDHCAEEFDRAHDL